MRRPACAEPSELLTHPNFAKLLKEASQFYDLIIVDTPPVLAVTDAVLVAQQAGTSLLVARCGQSTAAQNLQLLCAGQHAPNPPSC